MSPPPGTLAQTPPRRAARGRGDDMLFLTLGASAGVSSPALLDQAAHAAGQAYFGTPGTITAALREAADEVNQRLLAANQREAAEAHADGRLFAAVLRGSDLYLAQCGPGQAVLIRSGNLTRFLSEEAAARPLGLSVAPHVRFHHAQVAPGDLLLMTTEAAPAWSDPTLSGLARRNEDRVCRLGERRVFGSVDESRQVEVVVVGPAGRFARQARDGREPGDDGTRDVEDDVV